MLAIDYGSEEYIRVKNRKSTDLLLAMLRQHHGEPALEEPVVEEIVPDPEPTHSERGPRSAFQKWIDSFEPIPNVNKYPTVHDIKKCVSEQFDVPVLDLESARKTKKIVLARQVAMYLLKELTPRSFPDIGRKFGNRDHSTVIWAVRRIEEMMGADSALAEIVSGLSAKVQA
jgi:hypothetical protein